MSVTCEVLGCDRGAYYRKPYCQPHYARWVRHGDPLAGNRTPSPGAVCAVGECTSPATGGRGYCGLHYQRFRKTGDPLAVRLPTLEQRLWANIDRRGPDDCWPWTGHRNWSGYGILTIDGRQNQRAHRAVFKLVNGPLADDVMVRHTCDNPPCCNPAHLLPGSNVDNMRDMVERGGRRRRWTDDELEAVRTDPRPLRVVAAEYGMSESYAGLIRKQYRHGMHRTFT